MLPNESVAFTVRNPGRGFWMGFVFGGWRGEHGGRTHVPRPT